MLTDEGNSHTHSICTSNLWNRSTSHSVVQWKLLTALVWQLSLDSSWAQEGFPGYVESPVLWRICTQIKREVDPPHSFPVTVVHAEAIARLPGGWILAPATDAAIDIGRGIDYKSTEVIRLRTEEHWRSSCGLLRCLHFKREGDGEVLGF